VSLSNSNLALFLGELEKPNPSYTEYQRAIRGTDL
jgi:hypothetical protein